VRCLKGVNESVVECLRLNQTISAGLKIMMLSIKKMIPNALKQVIKDAVGARHDPGTPFQRGANPTEQSLGVYWEDKMAQALETWGENNSWHEIVFLMAGLQGKVLDIACGTGKVMEVLDHKLGLQPTGCDISDFLLEKAQLRGIPKERLFLEDATKMSFADGQFDYGYSIGSLEHFTEDGISLFMKECHRVVRKSTFHMIPVSRSGQDEGWLKTNQSFFNNSVSWWLEKYGSAYARVDVLDSLWNDDLSVGKWFLCHKD